MNDRRLDFYIQELYEMLNLFSLDQFVELYNMSFRGERPLAMQDFDGNLNEDQKKTEFINSVSTFEKEAIRRIYNVANQILSRRK